MSSDTGPRLPCPWVQMHMVLCARYQASNDELPQSLPSAWCLLEVVRAPEQVAERSATGRALGPLTRSFERETASKKAECHKLLSVAQEQDGVVIPRVDF